MDIAAVGGKMALTILKVILTSSYGLKQSICIPTHLFPMSDSFIGLIFTN